MKKTEAADMLRQFNRWRKGESDVRPSPIQITHALDMAVRALREAAKKKRKPKEKPCRGLPMG